MSGSTFPVPGCLRGRESRGRVESRPSRRRSVRHQQGKLRTSEKVDLLLKLGGGFTWRKNIEL